MNIIIFSQVISVCLSSRKFTVFMSGSSRNDMFHWWQKCIGSLFFSDYITLTSILPNIWRRSAGAQSVSLAAYLSHFSHCLPHFPPFVTVYLHDLCHCPALWDFFFFCLLRIKQAKVQILPERILPDPLSAVQLTPLSRLYVQPPAKSQTQSSNQDRCRWKNSQVGHTRLTLVSHISAEWFNKTKTNHLPLKRSSVENLA